MLWRSAYLLLATVTLLVAQRRAYDTFTFEPPAGYQSRESRDFLEFSRIDPQRKFYCQILLYRAQNSVGGPLDDLENQWKLALANSLRVRGKVDSREIPAPSGPANAVRLADTVDHTGKPVVTTLFVARVPGLYVGVLLNVPHAEALPLCSPDVGRLTASLLINPSPSAPVASPSTPNSLAGQWQRVVASPPSLRYNPFTQQWEHDVSTALNQFRNTQRWIFSPNGEYLRELDAESYNRSERARVLERGRYRAAQGVLQLEPQSYQEGKGPRRQDPPLTSKPAPAPYTLRFSLGEHPQYRDSAGLQVEETPGTWTTYKPQR